VASRSLELLGMHVLGFYLCWRGGNSPLAAAEGAGALFSTARVEFWVGLLFLGLAQGRCGWWMHEAGHYSATGIIWLDRRMQEFWYGLGCGMSGSWWRNQHNKHHATPQKLGQDVDLNTLPLVAFHSDVYNKVRNPIMKMWLKMQAYLFFPVITYLVAAGWQWFLHPRHAWRVKNFAELFWMGSRYVAWYFAFRHFGLAAVCWSYVIYLSIGSGYIFTNFAVSHTHKPVLQKHEHVDWVTYSANHTTNCTPGLICNWWMAYLNFQIEHHLFPSMPQFRHPTIAPRVKKLFETHGLHYDVRPFWTCIAVTFRNLFDAARPGHEHRD